MFSHKIPNEATARSLITMVFIILGILQGGCATLSPEQRVQLRQEVDSNAAESLTRFLEQEPGLQQDLNAVEYNGFTGSREQWVTSFNVRF
jgi:hypothetical protein